MQSREELAKRVKELEREVASLRGGRGTRAVRSRAGFEIANLPFYDIAFGPDFERGEVRGHARGVIALGDIATGVLAIGGLARGVIAIGGLAVGLVTVGGLSIGALAATGGLAIGGLAFGGGAVGGVAVGGGAAGYYVCAGGGVGEYVASATRRDPEAVAFFSEHGIGDSCGARRRYRP